MAAIPLDAGPQSALRAWPLSSGAITRRRRRRSRQARRVGRRDAALLPSARFPDYSPAPAGAGRWEGRPKGRPFLFPCRVLRYWYPQGHSLPLRGQGVAIFFACRSSNDITPSRASSALRLSRACGAALDLVCPSSFRGRRKRACPRKEVMKNVNPSEHRALRPLGGSRSD